MASSQFMDAFGALIPRSSQTKDSAGNGPIAKTDSIKASETQSKFLLNSMANQLGSKGTTSTSRLAPKVSIGATKKSNGSEIDKLLSAMGN